MQKWEYAIIEMGKRDMRNNLEENLNNYAAEGWEISHILQEGSRLWPRIIMRRPIQDKTPYRD